MRNFIKDLMELFARYFKLSLKQSRHIKYTIRVSNTIFLLVAFFSTLFLRSLMTKRVVKIATSKKIV
jgi:hypothetical protein